MLAYNGYLKIEKELVPLNSGKTCVREILQVKNAAAVLCRITGTDRYLLVKQYRAPAHQDVLEVVAGGVEKGELSSVSAVREVEEELGRKVINMKGQGCVFASPGISTEKLFLYTAEVSSESFPQKLDHDEEIEIVEYSKQELKNMAMTAQIKDAKTLMLILMEG